MKSSADKAAARAQDAGEARRDEGTGIARTDAAAALKPFLHEHAAQFWHELRWISGHNLLQLARVT